MLEEGVWADWGRGCHSHGCHLVSSGQSCIGLSLGGPDMGFLIRPGVLAPATSLGAYPPGRHCAGARLLCSHLGLTLASGPELGPSLPSMGNGNRDAGIPIPVLRGCGSWWSLCLLLVVFPPVSRSEAWPGSRGQKWPPVVGG